MEACRSELLNFTNTQKLKACSKKTFKSSVKFENKRYQLTAIVNKLIIFDKVENSYKLISGKHTQFTHIKKIFLDSKGTNAVLLDIDEEQANLLKINLNRNGNIKSKKIYTSPKSHLLSIESLGDSGVLYIKENKTLLSLDTNLRFHSEDIKNRKNLKLVFRNPVLINKDIVYAIPNYIVLFDPEQKILLVVNRENEPVYKQTLSNNDLEKLRFYNIRGQLIIKKDKKKLFQSYISKNN